MFSSKKGVKEEVGQWQAINSVSAKVKKDGIEFNRGQGESPGGGGEGGGGNIIAGN